MAARLSSFSSVNCGKAALKNCELNQHLNKSIVTIYPKRAIIVNLSNGRVEKDWSVKGRNSLGSPVCCSHTTNTYQAVIDNKAIHSWTENEVNIEKSPKIKLPKPAKSLVSTHLGPVLLYRDGTYAASSEPATVCGRAGVEEGQRYVWVTSHTEGNTTALVCLIAPGEEKEHVAMRAYVFTNSVEHAHCVQLDLRHSGTTWLSSTMLSKDGDIHILSLWSDCTLTLQSLADTSSLEDNFPPIKELDTTLASIAALDATQIAVCGIRTSKGVGVGIWDINYGVLKASTQLPEDSISECELHSFGSKLVLLSDRGMFISIAVAPVSTLGNLLGHYRACVGIEKLDEVGTAKQHPLCEAAERLLQNSTGSAFQQAFTGFIDVYKKHSGNGLLVSGHITTLIVRWSEKAKEDKNFKLPVCETKQLITSGLVTSSALENLLSIIVEGRHTALVYLCINHVDNIPEACLVRMLNFFIECEDNIIEEAASDVGLNVADRHMNGQQCSEDSSKCPLQRHKAAFINMLLQHPVNDLFLAEQLRKLTFPNAVVLLRYLHHILNICTESGVYDMPSINQVSDWLSSVLDAHFTQLILSQDARLLLAELHQTVATRVELIEEMNAIEEALTKLKERIEVPLNKSIGHYCIETLHI